jgi:hypothetical protein
MYDISVACRIVPLHPFALTGGIEPKHPSTYAVGGLVLGPNLTLSMTKPNRSFILMENIPNKFGFGPGSGIEGCVTVVVSREAKKNVACAVPPEAAGKLVVHCQQKKEEVVI